MGVASTGNQAKYTGAIALIRATAIVLREWGCTCATLTESSHSYSSICALVLSAEGVIRYDLIDAFGPCLIGCAGFHALLARKGVHGTRLAHIKRLIGLPITVVVHVIARFFLPKEHGVVVVVAVPPTESRIFARFVRCTETLAHG